jgi:hypothetical protein
MRVFVGKHMIEQVKNTMENWLNATEGRSIIIIFMPTSICAVAPLSHENRITMRHAPEIEVKLEAALVLV